MKKLLAEDSPKGYDHCQSTMFGFSMMQINEI